MKKGFAVLILSLVLGVMVLPQITMAASALFQWNFGTDRIISCTGDFKAGTKTHPVCTSVCDILETTNNIINVVSTYIFVIVFPALVLWGSILIVTAGARPANLEDGKKTVTAAVVGIIIMFCSVLLVKTFAAIMVGGATSSNAGTSGTIVNINNWPNFTCDASKIPGGKMDIDRLKATSTSANPSSTGGGGS